jgi:acyl carrier protein
MKLENLKKNLENLLKKFIKENEIEINCEIDDSTRLIGSSSIFDSMELVQFVVEVEDFLDEEYGFEIQLASEKAMSRRSSPFINLKSLHEFISE